MKHFLHQLDTAVTVSLENLDDKISVDNFELKHGDVMQQ